MIDFKLIPVFLYLIFILTSCSNKTDKLIPLKTNDEWIFFDENFNEKERIKNVNIFSAHYIENSSSLELIPAYSNENIGFVNKEGNFVIPPIYKSVTIFSQGRAIVVAKEDYPKIINEKGKVLHELKEFQMVLAFSENFAAVKKDDLYGYIDTSGSVVIEPQFVSAYKFKNGLARVQLDDESQNYGVINTKGIFVIEPIYKYMSDFNKDGFAVVMLNDKYGVINTQNRFIINPENEFIHSFNEGLATVAVDGKYGYIDEMKNVKIQPQYIDAKAFKNNYAEVMTADSLWGLIDKKGDFVINPKYKNLNYISDNFILFYEKEAWGVIDINGKEKQKPIYKEVGINKYNYESVAVSDYFDIDLITEPIYTGLLGNSYNGLTKYSAKIDVWNIYSHLRNFLVEKGEYLETNGFRLNDGIKKYHQYTFQNERLIRIAELYDMGYLKYDYALRLQNRILYIIEKIYPNARIEKKEEELITIETSDITFHLMLSLSGNFRGQLIFIVNFE